MMKKTSSVRLFFVLGAALCCAAYSGGYYYVQQKSQEPLPKLAETQGLKDSEGDETIESGTIVPAFEYLLKEQDGFVVVYYADGETLYDHTAIPLEQLPWKLQREIREGKQISSEMELYNFLESYSS